MPRRWAAATRRFAPLCLLAAAEPAAAASVAPGGALDLSLAGFVRFRAHGGALDRARLDNAISTGLGFSNDTELEIVARAGPVAGLDYGGVIKLMADTTDVGGAEETWLFLRGGAGEARLGDTDGVLDDDKVGGFSVAAGTGGIDGDIVDQIAVDVAGPFDSGTSTKVVLHTAGLGGLRLGLSYAPNGTGGADLAVTDQEVQSFIEGSIVYEGSLGEVDLVASVVGGACRMAGGLGDGCRTVLAGATLALAELEIGVGYGAERVGGGDRYWWNGGIALDLDSVHVSLTYGQARVSGAAAEVEGNRVGSPRNVVVSADLALAPGLVLAGDVGYFDNDVEAGPFRGRDRGIQAVSRLGLDF